MSKHKLTDEELISKFQCGDVGAYNESSISNPVTLFFYIFSLFSSSS